MELTIKGKNTEVSDSVRAYAERKLGNLDHKILTPPIEAIVELSRQVTKSAQDRYVVQVTIDSKGVLLRGEERASDFLTAIDNVAAVLKRQVERYKGRRYDKGKAAAAAMEQAPVELEEVPSEETSDKVVRFKRFVLRPMSVDEAIEQMELLGHSFFAFLDAGSGKTNVLYRRKDGNYGQIQLEVM